MNTTATPGGVREISAQARGGPPTRDLPVRQRIVPATLESHLQRGQLMLGLKVSMGCWMIADRAATQRKMRAGHATDARASTGGGPHEVAVAQGRLDAYLDLCPDHQDSTQLIDGAGGGWRRAREGW